MKELSVFIIIIISFSCTKLLDEREEIIGSYSGIGIHSYYEHIDTMYNFRRDTSVITLTLVKSSSDSIVELLLNNAGPSGQYLFKYSDSMLTSLIDYHPPYLRLTNDTLFFTIITGKTPPDWFDAIAKKTK